MKEICLGLVLVLIALCTSCTSRNTVEQTVNGQTEQYQIDKKTGLKDGEASKVDSSGHIFEAATYRQGELHGERVLYHDNGTPEIVEKYDNGILNGSYAVFYDNGTQEIKGQYTDGIMSGIWTRYYPDGQKMEDVTFADNLENGPFVEYHPNGALKAEGQYLNGGRENGLLKLYDTAGELEKTMQCDDGICQTTWERDGDETNSEN